MNAPRRWPNSSLSSRVSGSAAQLTARNGPSARVLAPWMPRATSSLPVPVSPSISTTMGELAALSMSENTAIMAGERPMMSSKPSRLTRSRRRAPTWARRPSSDAFSRA